MGGRGRDLPRHRDEAVDPLLVVQRLKLERPHELGPPHHPLGRDRRSGEDSSGRDGCCSSSSGEEACRPGDPDGRERSSESCSDDRGKETR